MGSFKTNKEWELKGVHRLLTPENERLYPFVESMLFGNYFIIDAVQNIESDDPDELCEFGRRFFITNTHDALSFILESNKAGLKHIGIALLQGDNLNKSSDYMSSLIEEIILYEDKEKQNAFVYTLKNGMRIVDSLLTQNEKELKFIGTMYKNKAITDHALIFLKP